MSSFARARIQQKCAYLSCALQMALEKYPCANGLGKWADCCEEAITALKYMPVGISPPKCERIIRNWFVDFRQNGRRLVVPSISMANNMKDVKLPPFLQVYPDLKNAIVEFADANIGDITVDVMHSYMNKCIGIVVENEALFRTPIDLTGGEESSTSCSNDDHENEKDKEDDGDNLESNLPNSSEDLRKQFQHAAVEHSPSISIASPSLKRPISSNTTPQEKRLIIKGLIKAPTRAATSSSATSSYIVTPQKKSTRTVTPQKKSTRTMSGKRVTKVLNQKKISRATAHNWMKILGYQYNELTKGFYTDNHEKEENIRYRIKFIRRYLFDYEPYMLRWIQIPISTVKEAYNGRKISVKVELGEENSKVRVITVEKEAVDTIMRRGRTYQDDEEKNGGMGVNQSYFRKDKTKAVTVCIGQDECIFKQFLVNKKAWFSKSGRFKLTPKDDGSGIMVSGLKSRELGFGFPEFETYTERINAYRHEKKYKDIHAAVNVNRKESKDPLESDPFIRLFEYGNAEGKEGYWTYDNMVLQLEDCIDILTVAFGKTYDYVFLFDHSCGHDRMRKDAINIHGMNVGFAGKQMRSHDSVILQHDGYLGSRYYSTPEEENKYGKQLQVGDTASFQFEVGSIGRRVFCGFVCDEVSG
eukprot:scaffold74802_cov56-Attheya_sp.AAC.1